MLRTALRSSLLLTICTALLVCVPSAMAAWHNEPALVTTVAAETVQGAHVDWTKPTATNWRNSAKAETVTCDNRADGMYPTGTTWITCKASGQRFDGIRLYEITVVDAPPVIDDSDVVLEATGHVFGVRFSTDPLPAVYAEDAIEGRISASCTRPVAQVFDQSIVLCTASDSHSTAVRSVPVRVLDTLAPDLTVPAPIVAEATGADGAAVTYQVSAVDRADGVVNVECNHASGARFVIGLTTVACSAHDRAGHTANANFSVTVQDTTGPVFDAYQAPADVEATKVSGSDVTYPLPTATDAITGAVEVTCNPAPGSFFVLGTNNVVCSATDAATVPNTTTLSFTLNVVDTTAPQLAAGTDLTVEATSRSGAAANFALPAATDIADPAPVVTCRDNRNKVRAPGDTFVLGATHLTCTAKDVSGNTSSSVSLTVTVVDTTAPDVVIGLSGTNGHNWEALSKHTTPVVFSAKARDLVDGSVTVKKCTVDGAAAKYVAFLGIFTNDLERGTHQISCSVSDRAGNTGTATFEVVVRDSANPVLIGHQRDIDGGEADSTEGKVVTFNTPVALDLVDGRILAVCVPPSGSAFKVGQTSVECTATDEAGNHDSMSFTITVHDTIAPIITTPAGMVVEASGAGGAYVSFTATSSDIYDGVHDAVCEPPSGSKMSLGSTLVHCTSTDRAGNVATPVEFRVLVRDTTGPTIRVPETITLDAESGAGARAEFAVSAYDAVDGGVSVNCDATSGSTFKVGTTSVHCTSSDSRGNQSSATFDVVVNALPLIPEAPRGANLVLRVGNPARLGCGYTASAPCQMKAGSGFNVAVPLALRSARYSAPTTARITAYVRSGSGWRATVTRTVASVSTRNWTYFTLNMYPNQVVKFVADSTPWAGSRGGTSVRYVIAR